MKLAHHLKRHSKTVASHIKKHHKKYLAGFFGGFAVIKLFALVIGLSAVQYTVSTHAQEIDGCTVVGQYYTGEYETGCVFVPESSTEGYLTDCITIPGYYTGGSLNESGELVDQIRIEETQEGCILTGQEIIPAHTEGCFMTGGYRTGGTEICDEELGTGDEELGIGDEEEILSQGNRVCESGDIVWSMPAAGNVVRDIFGVSWNYSGCVVSGVVLQLRDHNQQWITLTTLDADTMSYDFASSALYSFQYSGFYHIAGINSSGENYYLYTGTYTGSYSRFFTGYLFRLITSDDVVLNESSSFVIDNETPILSDISLSAQSGRTGYLVSGDVVRFSFSANESLSGVQVFLGSGIQADSSSISGTFSSYSRTVDSRLPQGPITLSLTYSDIAGNTGALVYTSVLYIDTLRPTATGFVFGDYEHGVSLSFVSSESATTSFSYREDGMDAITTGGTISAFTSHYLSFTGIQRDVLYRFALDIHDVAGNDRSYTGDFLWTNLGSLEYHVFVVPTGDDDLTGNLSTLALVLKQEIEKFNTCKNALSFTPIDLKINATDFLIHMPSFKKSQMKTLVNAFTLFVLDQMKHSDEVSPAMVTEITKKFDNFLIVLKLLRDDDNMCKQNLSNYHISQFRKALEEYNISLD